MTETEWLTCEEPRAMLELLRETGKLSGRGWRLFAVACCHRVHHLLAGEPSRKAVEVAERYADGMATYTELDTAYDAAFDVFATYNEKTTGPEPAGYAALAACDASHPDESADDVAFYVTEALGCASEKQYQAALIRDIFGDPFRPVAVHPAWLTSDVLALARGIYDDRAFDRMPILADALQDAGCENDDILSHCRGPGPHVRGCWVVDLVLRKT